MRLIDLQQNTPEWLEMRRKYVGASDVPTLILGGKQDIHDLYMEKKEGKVKKTTFAMERGKNLEETARDIFNLDWAFAMEPAVGISDEIPCLMASFDGWDGKTCLEIKCPMKVVTLPSNHPSYKRWWYQIQAQMVVSNAESAYLMVYHPDYYAVECVERDEDAIQKIKDACESFSKYLNHDIAPEKGETIPHREDCEATYAISRWIEAKRSLKEAEFYEQQARKHVLAASNGLPFECFGVTVKSYHRKGMIDYKAIPELSSVDLEKYRKEGSEVWSITE